MVRVRIKMLRPFLALSGPRPQHAEPIAFAHDHDACNMQLGQPARHGRFLRARHKIEQRLKQLSG
jgi:hypothetical protein